jgi:hypothetical protein
MLQIPLRFALVLLDHISSGKPKAPPELMPRKNL